MDLKKLEPNVTQDILAAYKTELQNAILSSFKKGLKQEIRIELKAHQVVDDAVQEAIEIESSLKKQNSLRNNTTSILFNFETPNPNKIKTVFCHLCKEKNHEALFCMKASCVYCKRKEYVSYHCRSDHVIKLICKLCSTEGHSIDACKLSMMLSNYCQCCQDMGHGVTQCPTIAEYEQCWKYKEVGRDPLTCRRDSARVSETCEVCGSASHTARNCPSALCKRCNNLGHSMKYCTIKKRMIWCAMSRDQGHEAMDCENANI